MRRRRVSFLVTLVLGTAMTAMAAPEIAAAPRAGTVTPKTSDRGPSRSPSLFDHTGRMDVNNLDMFVSNHGSIAYDIITGNAGLIFPRGSSTTALFAAGPWIGAMVDGEVRVAVGEYAQEYTPGPMFGGTYQADQFEFRNYRIDRFGGGRDDYLAYAVPQGAPVDGSGNPLVLGDVTIWSVFNDADPNLHTSDAGNTAPLGIEVQQTVFAFNRTGPLGNVIFVKWKLRNRGSNRLQQVYFSMWGDPDIGGVTDDLTGCDTTLALGYAYNATNSDALYGSRPPAVGFQLLRGPIEPVSFGVSDTLGMTAFGSYINGTDPVSFIETYNIMRGLAVDGTPIHVGGNPANPVTTYEFPGDPRSGSGWTDSDPNDRRMQVSTGPFTMSPGAEQEIVAAVIVGQGLDRLAAIDELRSIARVVASTYEDIAPELAVSAPASRSGPEGATVAFDVLADDPDDEPLTLSTTPLPLGATFVDHGDGTGSFEWLPGFDQAGTYSVTFTAARSDAQSASATTEITVLNVNRTPVADAGGPYVAFIGTPVSLNGSGSSDADGDPLTYEWTFGDATSGSGITPSHIYAAPGPYDVVLTVSDGATSGTDATTVSVLDAFMARAFTAGGNKSIRLSSGKATWCTEVEPVGRSFALTDVDLTSLVMKSDGTGSVSSIRANTDKSTVGADRDGNGVGEITACFSKTDLRLLFSNVQGQASLPVTLEGEIQTGGFFRAPLTVNVHGGGGPSTVATTPSPLRGRGAFEFATTRPGAVSIRLFDVAGRLVRTVAAERSLNAGAHRVEFDARDERGATLGGGIYFYRVTLPEGTAVGRLVVLP